MARVCTFVPSRSRKENPKASNPTGVCMSACCVDQPRRTWPGRKGEGNVRWKKGQKVRMIVTEWDGGGEGGWGRVVGVTACCVDQLDWTWFRRRERGGEGRSGIPSMMGDFLRENVLSLHLSSAHPSIPFPTSALSHSTYIHHFNLNVSMLVF